MTCLADDREAGRLPAEVHRGPRLPRPPGWDFDPSGPVEDADFETIRVPSVSVTRPSGNLPEPPKGHPGSQGLRLNRQGLALLRPGETRPGFRQAALVAGAVLGSTGIALFAAWPHVFPPVAAVRGGLHIEGVTTYVDPGRADGLFFSGSVVNGGPGDAEAPPLAVAVERARRTVARYHLGTSGHHIAPGGRFNFSGRLPTPGPGEGAVRIYFDRMEGGG